MVCELLKRQIRRCFGESPVFNEDMEKFLQAIDQAYYHYEEDRKLLLRSIELTSSELMETNTKLRESDEKHRTVLMKLISFVVALGEKEAPELPTGDLLEIANYLEMQIRERKIMASKLEQNEASLRAVIESTDDIIWSVDKNLRLVSNNANFLSNPFLEKGKIPKAGEKLEDYWESESWPMLEKLLNQALLGNRFRVEISHKAEEIPRYYDASFNPIITREGIVGVTLFCRDITDRKTMEQTLIQEKERAEKASRMKGELLANMSYELRTPLNAIVEYSELLAEELKKGNNTEIMIEDLNKIQFAGKHLLSLIDKILDITKI